MQPEQNEAQYIGIDYGFGSTNIDRETGELVQPEVQS